jgi:hypothetical protein
MANVKKASTSDKTSFGKKKVGVAKKKKNKHERKTKPSKGQGK